MNAVILKSIYCIAFITLLLSCEHKAQKDAQNQESVTEEKDAQKIVKLHQEETGLYKALFKTLSLEINSDTVLLKVPSGFDNDKDFAKNLIPTVYKDSTAFLQLGKIDSIYLFPFYYQDGEESGVFILKKSKDTFIYLESIGWKNFVFLPHKKTIIAFSLFEEDYEKETTFIHAKIKKIKGDKLITREKKIETLYLEAIENSAEAAFFYNAMMDSIKI